MSTRSGRVRQSLIETSPPRTRKGVSPTRSPARNRKSSPTGRSAQKSPSRKSPSRKSPSRKSSSKYPARKSPSRVVKDVEEKEALAPKSPAKRPAIKKGPEVRLEDVSSKVESFRSTRTRRYEYSIKDMPSSLQVVEPSILDDKVNGLETVHSITDIYGLRNRRNIDDPAPRRSSRLRDIVDSVPDLRRSLSKSLSKSVSESISKSIDTYSDDEIHDDLLQREKSQSATRKLATPLPSSTVLSQISDRYEFGGRICSAVLYLLIPLTVFSILILCSKSCSLISLGDLSTYKSISHWIDLQSSLLVVSNFVLQALFIALPTFGTNEIDEQGKKYCFNAFVSSFCTFCTLCGLDYYKVLAMDSILGSYLKMAIISYLLAYTLAIVLYVKSSKVDPSDLNPYGSSGNLLYDLLMGRQIHCYLLKINVKLWLARISNITTLILAILIFKNGFSIKLEDNENDNLVLNKFNEIISKIEVKPTILVYSMMQIVYSLYFIIGEKKIVSTFYWQSEGLGYLQIVSSILYPYYFTTISKYVADTDLQLSINVLIAASLLYLLGLTLMLISNSIKYEFRKNPLHPSLTHLDSMPTFHGKKLLVSNLWGILRHPNYTGDIMIHVALVLPGALTRNIVAVAPALITIFMLVHRMWRDHNRCRRRYGSAWQRYCKRVPSVFIPKVL